MSLLIDKTLKEFCEQLASSQPAPGGGSAAALAGLLGSALSMMVVNLSVGKKSYEALAEDTKTNIAESYQRLQTMYNGLSALVDKDTEAFNAYMAAIKLPKETDAEKQVRTEAMQKAAWVALEVPMATAQCCLDILKNLREIALYGNKNAVSDAGVGALLACGGLEGAALNVKINLPGIADELLRSEATKQIETIVAEGITFKKELLQIVNDRILH